MSSILSTDDRFMLDLFANAERTNNKNSISIRLKINKLSD